MTLRPPETRQASVDATKGRGTISFFLEEEAVAASSKHVCLCITEDAMTEEHTTYKTIKLHKCTVGKETKSRRENLKHEHHDQNKLKKPDTDPTTM